MLNKVIRECAIPLIAIACLCACGGSEYHRYDSEFAYYRSDIKLGIDFLLKTPGNLIVAREVGCYARILPTPRDLKDVLAPIQKIDDFTLLENDKIEPHTYALSMCSEGKINIEIKLFDSLDVLSYTLFVRYGPNGGRTEQDHYTIDHETGAKMYEIGKDLLSRANS